MLFLANTIYSLKRRYGSSLTYRSFVSKTRDLDTGAIAQVCFSINIRLALIFPEKMARQFIYDLAYVAANKNFTYGGFFDSKTQLIALDYIDLGLVEPKVDDHVILGNERFEVKKVVDYPEDRVALIIVERLENQVGQGNSNIIISPDLSPDLAWGESAGDTINVGHLIFANGQDLYLASEDDRDRPAMGIVTNIANGKIYHTRNNIVRNLTILGAPNIDYKDIYLGVAGGMTFDRPENELTQKIGFVLKENLDATFDVIVNITDNILAA
jgi:hypothetical protein